MSTRVEPDPLATETMKVPLAREAQAGVSKRAIAVVIVAVLAVAALWWGVNKWRFARVHESTDNAQVDGNILPVLTKVSGYVQNVRVRENQPVKAGDTLVDLDDAEFRVRQLQAQADLAAAQAAFGGGAVMGQSQAAVATSSSQQGALEAQLQAARANAQRAHQDLARMQTLVAKQIVSRQQLDAAQAAADAADANVTALQQQIGAAGANVTSAEAGVRLARARLDAARAARDNAALQLSYTHLIAPEGGTVARKQVDVGQLLQAGQPVLAIVSDSAVWVTANFKETQLAEMRVGQPVELKVDAYKGCTADGRIESIGSATGARFALLPPDNATGNFTKVVQRVPVRIAVTKGCGEGQPLKPGMSVEASVRTR
jgi:membrane fusion protein, multidrug efflux system